MALSLSFIRHIFSQSSFAYTSNVSVDTQLKALTFISNQFEFMLFAILALKNMVPLATVVVSPHLTQSPPTYTRVLFTCSMFVIWKIACSQVEMKLFSSVASNRQQTQAHTHTSNVIQLLKINSSGRSWNEVVVSIFYTNRWSFWSPSYLQPYIVHIYSHLDFTNENWHKW